MSTSLILPELLVLTIIWLLFWRILLPYHLISLIVHIHLVTLIIHLISYSPLVFLLLAISMILLALFWLIFQEKFTTINMILPIYITFNVTFVIFNTIVVSNGIALHLHQYSKHYNYIKHYQQLWVDGNKNDLHNYCIDTDSSCNPFYLLK